MFAFAAAAAPRRQNVLRESAQRKGLWLEVFVEQFEIGSLWASSLCLAALDCRSPLEHFRFAFIAQRMPIAGRERDVIEAIAVQEH